MAENEVGGYTRWGVLASGEGGGRVASQFFARTENPGIGDRIFVINTNRSDIRNTIERIRGEMEIDEVDEVFGKYALEFGETQGVGNNFALGEEAARAELNKLVQNMGPRLSGADAFLHLATLGGGTGNGSIPVIIDEFMRGEGEYREGWMDNLTHAAFAIWPYYYEPPQRHFNAICGLSRLLRRSDGGQNADMVLLASNSHINNNTSSDGDFQAINEEIISAIDLMIGAGRETRGVIDVQDYISVPSQIGAHHFAPGVVTGKDAEMFELEYILENAAQNAFVPLDVSTTRAAFAIVRAPRQMVKRGAITEPAVNSAFQEWKTNNGIKGAAGMATLKPTARSGNKVDALVLLGGFDLDPLLQHSWEQYEQYRENIFAANMGGESRLSKSDIQAIEDNLEDHQEINQQQ